MCTGPSEAPRLGANQVGPASRRTFQGRTEVPWKAVLGLCMLLREADGLDLEFGRRVAAKSPNLRSNSMMVHQALLLVL